MDYQIWTKQGYSETWERKDAGDEAALKRILEAEVKAGHDPVVTVEVPWELTLKIGKVGEEPPKPPRTPTALGKILKEGAKSEADKGKAGPGEDPGAESPG